MTGKCKMGDKGSAKKGVKKPGIYDKIRSTMKKYGMKPRG